MTARTLSPSLLAAMLVAFGTPSYASENSTRRIDAGCFPSDAPEADRATTDACGQSALRFSQWLQIQPEDGTTSGTGTIGATGAANSGDDRGGPPIRRWISNSNGNWNAPVNWVDGAVPANGDRVAFGVNENDLLVESVDVDSAGNGIVLPGSVLQIERKTTFSDSSAGGDPLLADDAMRFDEIQANGAGGTGVVFNVPVSATTFRSNRHGATFNREFSAVSILARSAHQDAWRINASSTAPVEYVVIDEERGPDGDSIDGTFDVNANLAVLQFDQVWGRLRVGADALLTVDNYLYFQYVNQLQNNNINPIVLNGNLTANTFQVFDTTSAIGTNLKRGTYGSLSNLNAGVQVAFITGDGLLTVTGGPEIFADGFE